MIVIKGSGRTMTPQVDFACDSDS